jgi:hypothetical protein
VCCTSFLRRIIVPHTSLMIAKGILLHRNYLGAWHLFSAVTDWLLSCHTYLQADLASSNAIQHRSGEGGEQTAPTVYRGYKHSSPSYSHLSFGLCILYLDDIAQEYLLDEQYTVGPRCYLRYCPYLGALNS